MVASRIGAHCRRFRGPSARGVAATSANAIAVIADFDTDGVPPAVFLSAGRITQIVLLAQLVGDARRRRIQIVGVVNDLCATAAVVGEVAQRHAVDRVGAVLEIPAARGAFRTGRWRPARPRPRARAGG